MKRRIIGLILTAGMLATSIAGCGSTASTSASAGSAADASSAASAASTSEEVEEETAAASSGNAAAQDTGDHEDVTIEVDIVQTDWAEQWDAMKEKFESEYPWITVENVGLGEDQLTFLTNRAAAQDLPDVCQMYMNQVFLDLADEGLIEDASKYDVAQDIPESYRKLDTYNGKLLGLTQGAAASCMYYNMQILKDAGWDEIPTTFDELIQCCKDVQDKTGKAPIVVAGGKATTVWFPVELLVAANIAKGDLTEEDYENQFKDGKFDFTADPSIAEKMDQLAPYFLTGSSSMQEEDTFTAMADGDVAMCLAGNWNSAALTDAVKTATGGDGNIQASFPPFSDDAAKKVITVSPEDFFAVTVDESRSADEQEAVDTFYNWVFQPENFKIIQNARGTLPVLTTLEESDIVLPDCMKQVASDIQGGDYSSVTMGFNLWTAPTQDVITSELGQWVANGSGAAEALKKITDQEAQDYMNMEG